MHPFIIILGGRGEGVDVLVSVREYPCLSCVIFILLDKKVIGNLIHIKPKQWASRSIAIRTTSILNYKMFRFWLF
jgi:hypothetical protein